jgi:beta-glucosidase
MKFSFGKNFLWGSSTSSYQVEGNNNCDWTRWEKENNLVQAGQASNHFQKYEEDFALAKELGQNAHRLSFEWSRIIPSEGNPDYHALEHYRRVIDSLKQKNIEPVVTLHHFTNPLWFSNNGGWINRKSIKQFSDYVQIVLENFKDVNYWITFNEPYIFLYQGFLNGIWPPGYRSLNKALKALSNIKKTHLKVYRQIKKINPQAKISIAKNVRFFSPCQYKNFGQNNFFAYLRSYLFNFQILDALTKAKTLDFIGVNYYAREFVKMGGLIGQECQAKHHPEPTNKLNWHTYPRGLYYLLLKLKKYNLPIIISENGTVENNDYLYYQFLISHLNWLAKAMAQGVKVEGYFWWSLLDNFEWEKGFWPRFGLVRVDYKTFRRQLKPFALEYKKICQNNYLYI